MGPEKWKDEVPHERKGGQRPEGEAPPAREASDDPREEEGWFQPESSAQKGPAAREPEE